MASLNGGFVGIDYEPESGTQSAVTTTFNSSGTLTTAANTVSIDYLVVAGGGGGGIENASTGVGGGAGAGASTGSGSSKP